jgi:membrane peptidoglycan carboxypeptidase
MPAGGRPVTDNRRPGRHSFDADPRWPVADHDPQWPTGDEPQWPAADPPRARPRRTGSAQSRQPGRRRLPDEQQPVQTPRRAAQRPGRGAPANPQWPADPDAVPRRRPPTQAGRRAARTAAPGAAQVADPNGVTEMLPPIDEAAYQVGPPREPELLTHRYHDNGGEPYDPDAEQRINALLGDAEGEYGEDLEDGELTPEERKKRRWKRIRRVGYGFVGVFVVLPIVAFAIAYFLVDIPKPAEIAAAQAKTVTYFYSDGKKVLGRDSQDGNRVILKPDQIPDVVKQAVYAAEDESFETNSGFDITGIVRAAMNQLTGGSGGGSTISQQYIKQATGDDERTIIRKGLEIVKAFKMNNELSKSEIITAYLNTIYFGRGAYGIQAASEAYFNRDVDKLSPSQAAYLAGIIQAPSRGDTREYAEQRWNYVIGQMEKNNWLTGEERAKAKFPTIRKSGNQSAGFGGPRFYIKQQITAELEDLGYSAEEVRLQGYKVYTTIDQRAQKLAEETVRDVMEGEPKNLHEALVAVDPKTGGVKAYYGGPNNNSDQTDWARRPRNPGSSIKPFDFVGLLKQGKGPYATYDGSSPRTFPGDGKPIHNSEGNQCPNPCSVMKAMEQSINTVFYDIVANEVKPTGVIQALKEAGVNTSTLDDRLNLIAIGGGDNKISPRDMAAAYATFSADGLRRDSHFVSKITTPDGEVMYQAKNKGKPAFDNDPEKSKQIAGNVTKTLGPVLPYSDRACAAGRACAGKTGTHEAPNHPGENSQAWMAGYTRQLSTAVWVGDAALGPIKNMDGGRIYGSGLPGAIWQQFMDKYHEGMDNEPFPEVKLIGEAAPPPPPPPEQEEEEDEDKPTDKPDKPGKPTKPTEPTEPTTEPTEPTEPAEPTCQPPFCRPEDEQAG